MTKVLCSLLLILAVANPATAQRPRDNDLREGDPAPHFTLKDSTGEKEVTLSQLRDKPTVLVFGSCT